MSLLTVFLFTPLLAIAQTPPHPLYATGERVMEPRPFAEGTISTDMDEAGGPFSPDGKDFYFTVTAPYTTAPRFSMICIAHFKDGRWQRPQTVSFSGQYLDFAPQITPDGSMLYFTSVRPTPSNKVPRYRIWVATKLGDGWSTPAPLPPPINQEDSQSLEASADSLGNIYFTSNRNDPGRHLHIFRSRLVNGQYEQPEKLGPEINSEFSEVSPAISPDGKVLVFASNSSPEDPDSRRPQDLIADGKPYPRQDLYVSFLRHEKWTPARHLEHGINSFAEEGSASFTPDGKYLFWGSEGSDFNIPTKAYSRKEIEKLWNSPRNGRGNIYFISTEALETAAQEVRQ